MMNTHDYDNELLAAEDSYVVPLDNEQRAQLAAEVRQKLGQGSQFQEQKFEIKDNNVHAAVHDTADLRSAFLYYCSSNVRPNEMHLAVNGPCMTAQQFTDMVKDLNLAEPEGPMPMLMLGITYATSKDDDDEGLSYACFLDALLELAFECRQNVAGTLQDHAKARQLQEEDKAAHSPGDTPSSTARRRPRSMSRGFMRPSAPSAILNQSVDSGMSHQGKPSYRNTLVSCSSLTRRAMSMVMPEASNAAAGSSRPLSSVQHKRFNDMAQSVKDSPDQDQQSEEGSPIPLVQQQQLQYSRFTRLSSPVALHSPSNGGGVTNLVSSPGLQRLDSISRLTERVASARLRTPVSAVGLTASPTSATGVNQSHLFPQSWEVEKVSILQRDMSDCGRMMGCGRSSQSFTGAKTVQPTQAHQSILLDRPRTSGGVPVQRPGSSRGNTLLSGWSSGVAVTSPRPAAAALGQPSIVTSSGSWFTGVKQQNMLSTAPTSPDRLGSASINEDEESVRDDGGSESSGEEWETSIEVTDADLRYQDESLSLDSSRLHQQKGSGDGRGRGGGGEGSILSSESFNAPAASRSKAPAVSISKSSDQAQMFGMMAGKSATNANVSTLSFVRASSGPPISSDKKSPSSVASTSAAPARNRDLESKGNKTDKKSVFMQPTKTNTIGAETQQSTDPDYNAHAHCPSSAGLQQHSNSSTPSPPPPRLDNHVCAPRLSPSTRPSTKEQTSYSRASKESVRGAAPAQLLSSIAADLKVTVSSQLSDASVHSQALQNTVSEDAGSTASPILPHSPKPSSTATPKKSTAGSAGFMERLSASPGLQSATGHRSWVAQHAAKYGAGGGARSQPIKEAPRNGPIK
ncbi:hypothetical protein CEUSTIGMA_g10303.t1 [Chlamydomonas eustigma]|uniref:Uncharacterized protein n=1 Tax=Chlamydomonas eustigma TaxID=1157962 RepID=A0A250XIF9_9CHLO|nr:hypothetical protein CEUSTIGMA_g10303.t1 [Chlamydomonas eustigma]|eukprot:GAX82877.1 hypothetical protein CEUSTIGMA_g10303.t1 [Chlamydomonas eustigma]